MQYTLGNSRRQAHRQALVYYPKVIDIETENELGRVADITIHGMMLFGSNALNEKKTYRVRIITEGVFDESLGNVDVSVQIRWSRPDMNPALILTGMLFLDLSDTDKETIKALVRERGMNHPLGHLEQDTENEDLDEEEL